MIVCKSHRFRENNMEKEEIYTAFLFLCLKDHAYSTGRSELDSKSLLASIRHCIDNGADVNSRSFESNSFLCMACDAGDVQVVKLLVEAGADVNLKGPQRYRFYPIQRAIETNNFELMKYLLENGVPLDFKSEVKKYTLLHYAANRYSIEIIEFLLEKGLDVNARDFYDKTPLHHACCNWGHPDCQAQVIKLFLEYGADVTIKDRAGFTPMDVLKELDPTDIDPELIPLLESYAKKGK